MPDHFTSDSQSRGDQIELLIDKALDSAMYEQQRQYLKVHRQRYIYTLETLKKCLPIKSFLEIGSTGLFLKLISQLCPDATVSGTDYADASSQEYRSVPFTWEGIYNFYTGNPEQFQYSIPDESFDLVLCAEVIEHMSIDPMSLLAELNRTMKTGGQLLITTPNIVSSRSIIQMLNHEMPYGFYAFNKSRTTDRHNIEYSPGLLSELVVAAGFDIDELTTHYCWSGPDEKVFDILNKYQFRQDLRGDNIFLTCTKKSDVIDRYPSFLYI